jgi:hypothetical protein
MSALDQERQITALDTALRVVIAERNDLRAASQLAVETVTAFFDRMRFPAGRYWREDAERAISELKTLLEKQTKQP